ncbi:MAG TPA: hypothetical protein VEC11_12420 [Allosphingosinicella sp.]|nr:hypothetical protein [Allosphingosinicella sp.]
MKFIAFAAVALLATAPGLAAQRHRALAGGDPDLDLTVRPRADARTVEPGRDDNVYLPGLTERADAESAADMRNYKGQGGPLEDSLYPPCSARVTDRCIQLPRPRR